MSTWNDIRDWVWSNYEFEYDRNMKRLEIFYDLEEQIRSVYLQYMVIGDSDNQQEFVQIFAPIGYLSDNDIFDLLAEWSDCLTGGLTRFRRSDCIYCSCALPLRDGVESAISTMVTALAQQSAQLEEVYLGTDAKCMYPKKFKVSEYLVLIDGGDMDPFYISKYEVTQELYQSVTGVNANIINYVMGINNVGPQKPVDRISWYDAIRFCNMLSMKEGKAPVYSVNGKTDVDDWNYTAHTGAKIDGEVKMNIKANGYRLPTVAEWKFAAAGGENYTYAGSDDIDEVAWYEGNSGNESHKVGRKKPNRYGLYDMSGNVNEWCWDSFHNDYRRYCGGCWYSKAGSDNKGNNCTVAFDFFQYAYSEILPIGIRLVCSK